MNITLYKIYKYNTFQGDSNPLQGEYNTFQGDYNPLQGEYNTLQGDQWLYGEYIT